MFSRNLARHFLYAATALSLLSSCGLINNDKNNQPQDKPLWDFRNDGAFEANQATVAYSQGNFKDAETQVTKALQVNPKQPQALMVGAMLYEQLGRPNRARQYYEDLIVLNGNDTTILGSTSGAPEKMSEIAKKRLRLINVKQSKLVVEEQDGAKIFSISDQAGLRQSKSAIAKAIFAADKTNNSNLPTSTEEQIKSAEILFTDNEQNMISRFLILKELAEKDLITKEEFLNGRMTNIGALLPLTNSAPAYGVDKPVPSADLIIERIAVLKDAVEARAITPREFSAERNLIIEALLPPNPRQRMSNKAPSKDIMGAAKDLRKLEVLQDLNLITSQEKSKEQIAVEKYLGINKAPAKAAAAKPAPKALPAEIIETQVEITEKIETSAPVEDVSPAKPLIPSVTSPF